MFNLLVSAAGWQDRRDTISLDRIFEYTDDAIRDRYSVDGNLEFAALTALPTLFVDETFGQNDPIAKVGNIRSARIQGRDIVLRYDFDTSVPAMRNSMLMEFGGDLEIEDFEFQRTHWAVKDVDLFRELLRNLPAQRRQPQVFELLVPELVESTVGSAMMPFAQEFDQVYDTILQACAHVGVNCRRADNIWENAHVMQDVVSLIDRSRVVICDCSGRNPNVFYEIGIAHTLGREVILITQSENDIPFDLRAYRYIHYLPNAEGLAALGDRLRARLGDVV